MQALALPLAAVGAEVRIPFASAPAVADADAETNAMMDFGLEYGQLTMGKGGAG